MGAGKPLCGAHERVKIFSRKIFALEVGLGRVEVQGVRVTILIPKPYT